MKIKLPCVTKTGYETVEATILHHIAPHLAQHATFALHRGIPTDAYYRKYWFVSNVETGAAVEWNRSKAQAIRLATETLAKQDATSLLRAYSKVNGSSAAEESRKETK